MQVKTFLNLLHRSVQVIRQDEENGSDGIKESIVGGRTFSVLITFIDDSIKQSSQFALMFPPS